MRTKQSLKDSCLDYKETEDSNQYIYDLPASTGDLLVFSFPEVLNSGVYYIDIQATLNFGSAKYNIDVDQFNMTLAGEISSRICQGGRLFHTYNSTNDKILSSIVIRGSVIRQLPYCATESI